MATITDHLEIDLTVALAEVALLEARVDQIIKKLHDALRYANEELALLKVG